MFSEVKKLGGPFVNFKIQNLYNLAPKSGGGSSASIISTHPKISLRKGFGLAGLISWLLSPKWDFFFFLNRILYVIYILAYCYPDGQTVLEKNYFWKVLLPQLEAKITKCVSVGKCPRCSSIKSTKKEEKLPPVSEKC